MNKDLISQNTIFSTITGSKAYGMDTPKSDTDIRGVAILNDITYYFGFMKKFEQFEDSSEDTVIYGIQKAFRLMSDANPNMLELLYIPERFYVKSSKYWEKILEHRDKFLSKNIRYRYLGYGFAQLKRIKTARNWLLNPPKNMPTRSDFGLPERRMISKEEMGAFQWILVNLLKNSLDHLNLSEETKLELGELDFIGQIQSKGISEDAMSQIQKTTGASDEWMTIMQTEQRYNNAKRYWDSYQSWKNSRNKKRAELEEKFGYDTKHASHLVRLMRMGKEILETGQVHVFRPDREELLGIRNGSWKYKQVEEYAEKMQEEIVKICETSKLPNKPNKSFLDGLCSDVVGEYIKK